jgi:hypothetical protein
MVRKVIGNQALKYAMAGIAGSCLGAAVFAAPMTITPKAKVLGAAQRTSETKTLYAPLGKGPASGSPAWLVPTGGYM